MVISLTKCIGFIISHTKHSLHHYGHLEGTKIPTTLTSSKTRTTA